MKKSISPTSFETEQYAGYSADYTKFNYRFGFNLEYALKGNISINTAISYSNNDFNGVYYCWLCTFNVLPKTQIINFRYIEVPLTFKYYFLRNKVRPFGEIGLKNIFLLNKELTNKAYTIGLKYGAGIDYKLTETVSLQATLDYNSSICKLNKGSDFKLKTLAFGIGVAKRL